MGASRTILVADDSPAIQKIASSILAGNDLQVIAVANGVAAIKKYDSENPAVVLADVSMPGKDGYEVCNHIKSSNNKSKTLVLLVVGEMEQFDEDQMKQVHADGIVRKPFNVRELFDTVHGHLAKLLEEPPPEEMAVSEEPVSAVSPLDPPFEMDMHPYVPPMEPMQERPLNPDFSVFYQPVAFTGIHPQEEQQATEETTLGADIPAPVKIEATVKNSLGNVDVPFSMEEKSSEVGPPAVPWRTALRTSLPTWKSLNPRKKPSPMYRRKRRKTSDMNRSWPRTLGDLWK